MDRLSGTKGCVLWYPGSFAPFHLGHLNCLRAARKGLENVLGAYVQPQPRGHLAYKMLDQSLERGLAMLRNLEETALLGSDMARLRVLELVLSKEDWTMVELRLSCSGPRL